MSSLNKFITLWHCTYLQHSISNNLTEQSAERARKQNNKVFMSRNMTLECIINQNKCLKIKDQHT